MLNLEFSRAMAGEAGAFAEVSRLCLEGGLTKHTDVYLGTKFCIKCRKLLYIRFDAVSPLCVHFDKKLVALELSHATQRSVLFVTHCGAVADSLLKIYPLSVYQNRYTIFFSDFLKQCSLSGKELALCVSRMDLMEVEECGRCQKRVGGELPDAIEKRAKTSSALDSEVTEFSLRLVDCAIDWVSVVAAFGGRMD